MKKTIILKAHVVRLDDLAREIASTTPLSVLEALEFIWQVVCHDETFPVYLLGEGLPYKLDPIGSCNALADTLSLIWNDKKNESEFSGMGLTAVDAVRIKQIALEALTGSGTDGSAPNSFAEKSELPYLDRSHPHYAPKLAAAVHAWNAVGGSTFDGRRSPKQAVTEWLRRHAKEFGLINADEKPSESSIAEIAKVTNWQPKGGAPKTPTK